jgi:hypothetical protein
LAELAAGGTVKRNYGYRDIPSLNPMSPENRALYERRMAEIKAEERRKHPKLLEIGRHNPNSAENWAQYERRIAEIKAEERRKHPELLKLKFRRESGDE